MRRLWLLVPVFLLAAAVAGWFVLRPTAMSASRLDAGTARPTRTAWFDFGGTAPSPAPPPGSDAGATHSLKFRGRTALSGKGTSATVHAGEATFDSAADGTFERTQDFETSLPVWAEAPGARSQVVTLTETVEGEVWLELLPVTRITGRVFDEVTGAPLPGVSLEAAGQPAVRTTADGRFTVPAAPGELELKLSARGYRSLTSKLLLGPAGRDLSLRLSPLQRFAGVVVDSEGHRVPSASLRAEPATGDKVDLRADADGGFELWAEAPVILVGWSDTAIGPTQMISTAREDLRVVLRPACRASVDVTVDGQPFAGARASLSTKNGFFSLEAEKGTTTDAGQVTLGPVACGDAKLEVTLAQGWYGGAVERAVSLTPPVTPLSVALPGGRRLEGRVVDAQTREPVAHADVALRTGAGAAATLTDADGHFELYSLPPGELTLTVESPIHAALQKTVTNEAWVDVVLDGAREVRGRAVNASGAPWRQVQVDSVAQFTEAGAFHVRISAAKQQLLLSCDSCVPVTVTVPDGDANLGDVVLIAAAAVDVTVLEPSGRPAPGAVVFIGSPDDFGTFGHSSGSGSGVADVDGHAQLVLPPDACVHAWAPAFASSRECPGPGAAHVTVTLTEGAWVSGVVRSGGRPQAGAAIAESRDDKVATTGPDGRYSIGPLSVGAHELFWLPPGVSDALMGQRATVQVTTPGERLTKDLGTLAGSRVDVWVRNDIAGDMAILMAGQPSDVLSSGDGVFLQLVADGASMHGTFNDVAPGTWTLFLPGGVDGSVRREVVVAPDRDTRVVIDSAGDETSPDASGN